MDIVTLPVNTESLTTYSKIPISFEVKSRLAVELPDSGLGGIVLHEEAVVPSYVKDYGETKDESPMHWLQRFDTSNWCLFLAREDSAPVGAAAVALHTAGVHILSICDREDMAVLWDIRVHPGHRNRGIGRALFGEAARWARKRNCVYLQAETQNVNVPACRFYARQGCLLGEINRLAYSEPELAHETMLIWYLDLRGLETRGS